MKSERVNTKIVLIDLKYHDSMNAFEYFFGDHVSYQEFEQKSYIEFKETMFEKINKNIKFRKFGRIGNILTVKADMLEKEIERFQKLRNENEIKLMYQWIISDVVLITDNKLPDNYKNFKKSKLKELDLDNLKIKNDLNMEIIDMEEEDDFTEEEIEDDEN
jgi:hypothetical protein